MVAKEEDNEFKFVLPISDYMKKRLESVFDKISRDELYTRINEFFKYIYLSSVNIERYKAEGSLVKGSFIPVNKNIDDIWHEFILQTREYEYLCKSLPGKSFIHHQSGKFNEYKEKHGFEGSVKRLLDYLPGYVKYFGKFTNKGLKYWTIPNCLVSSGTLSIEQLNNILLDELTKNSDKF